MLIQRKCVHLQSLTEVKFSCNMIHVHTGFRCVLEACTQLEAQGQAEHRGQFQGGLRDVGERLGLQQVLVVIDLHDGEQEGTDEVLRVLPLGVENFGAVADEESL